MNRFRKFLSVILALVLFFSLMPILPAASAAGRITVYETYINPLYREFTDESELKPLSSPAISLAAEPEYLTDIDEAGSVLREGIKQRQETCTVYFQTDSFDGDEMIRKLIQDIASAAQVHTGVPTEGDYIMWQYSGWNAGAQAVVTGGAYEWTLTYTYSYYTTAAEEAKVDSKVAEVLNALNVSSGSSYQKVQAVYDYICENVTYDYDHLNDSSYKKQFTAYGALVDGTSVCQGYALLLYRLALELGVDCRLVPGASHGENHGWNIVKLGNRYYNVDSTWDAGATSYSYFLKCPANFTDHTRDAAYDTTEFHNAYPMADADYDASSSESCTHSYAAESTAATCTEDGITIYTCSKCGDSYSEIFTKLGHSYSSVVTQPTCTAEGYTTHTCSRCEDTYTDSKTDAKGHSWDNGTVTKEPTETETGTREYKCSNCTATKTETIPALGSSDTTGSVYRIMGENRYETAFEAAQMLKTQLGVEKFSCIVVASGTSFADALPGSYLANQNQAPILLVNQYNVEKVADYILENTYSASPVYILGGEAAVPASLDALLKDEFTLRRLAGRNRYATNLLILEAAEVNVEDLLVCTGNDFADSLSASALRRPILLVNKTLNDDQKAFLETLESNDIYIIGGTSAVSEDIEQELKNYSHGYVERISGDNRYETSVMVAEKFFPLDVENLVLAYGHNFPDGLCGGVLAYFMNAPLILTRDRNAAVAAEFAAGKGVTTGAVLGGASLISDDAVRQIFSMSASQQIIVK